MKNRRANVLFAVGLLSLAIYCLACYTQSGVVWAPGDDWFAFTCISPTARGGGDQKICTQLWIWDLRSGKATLVDQNMLPISRPAIFPDGRSILYLVQDEVVESRMRVFRYQLNEGTRKELGALSLGKEGVNASLLWGPQLSDAGTEFAVMVEDPKEKSRPATVVVDMSYERKAAAPPAGAPMISVKQTLLNLGYAHWTPDGKALVGIAGTGPEPHPLKLVHVDVETQKRTELAAGERPPDTEYAQCFALVSPKGSYVADLRTWEGAPAGKLEPVVLSLKDAKSTTGFNSPAIPLGWAGDESALYVLAEGADGAPPKVVRWNFKSGEKTVVYDLPEAYASQTPVFGTLSHDASKLVLRMGEDDKDKKGDLLLLVDLKQKTAVPLLVNDTSRLRMIESREKAMEALVNAGKVAELKQPLADYLNVLHEQAGLMITPEAKDELVRKEFDLYFEALDDPVKALSVLGKEGNDDLRIKCLVRMGKMDEALKLAEKQPAPENEVPQMAKDIEEFQTLDKNTNLADAEEHVLRIYVDWAAKVGATDKAIKACREYLKRFPDGDEARKIDAKVKEYDRWAPLRQAKP